MSKGKRYNGENNRKINIKKVLAVAIAMVAIVMLVVIVIKLVNNNKNNVEKNITLSYYAAFDNKWGVINSKGEEVINCSYDEMILIPNPEKDVFIITSDVNYNDNTYNSKAINSKGEQLFDSYEKVECIQNIDKQNSIFYATNCLKVMKNGKYGLIDFTGKQLLNCEYDDIYPIKNIQNSLITIKDGNQGLVSQTGTIIIENEYAEISALTDKYEDGYIVKNSKNEYGVIGTNKKIIVPVEYEKIENVNSEDIYIVKEEKKIKIYNASTTDTTDITATSVKSINDGNIIIKKADKYGIISSENEEKIEAKYEDLTYLFSNYYIAKLDEKYGIIDINGETKIDFKYKNLKYRADAGFIEASTESAESDLISKSLTVELTGIISELNIEKGYMKVRVGSEYKYYNFKFEEKKNTEILTTNLIFLDKKDGKYGYINKDGVVVVNYIYDDATEENSAGYAAVKKDGKWGAIDAKGKEIVPTTLTMENNIVINFIGKWHLAEDTNAEYYIK